MYEWSNANVDSKTRKAFEIATDIAWRFYDKKVRSAYLLFAAMHISESAIYKTLNGMDLCVLPDIDYILVHKEIFAEIFGENAAEKVFAEKEFEFEAEKEEPLTEDEIFTEKVLDVLFNFIEANTEEETKFIERLAPAYSDKLEDACETAYIRSKAMKREYIDLDLIVYSILENSETSAYEFIYRILEAFGIKMQDFMEELKVASNFIEEDDEIFFPVVIPKELETCLEVLNDKYVKGEEIVILGRDKEIYKAFNIFSKKTKRNTVLVGHPGVGKTAIMEAITQKIVNETCPREFIGYTVLSLDVNAMVAGTKYRGDFETKVAILKDFLQGTKKIILFVDEMHQMLGAGGTAEGTVDLSGSLKPILSRDDVVSVGATTINEYESILSRDGAFKRRFEVIFVKEPKHDEVKAMIKARLKTMEKYHGVKMPNNLVDYIILCSSCFTMDNANPDKTLDLCDRSMAIAKMANRKSVTKADVNKVYEEYFERHNKRDFDEVKSTAYHEIGHYIVTRHTKKHQSLKVIAISIVPAGDYLGVNMLEYTDNIVPCDMEYVESYIMSLLAGRVAQFKVSKSIDSGATSDLKRAKEFAKKVIAEYGMDEGEFKNIYLLDDVALSQKLAEAIDEKVNALIKKVYKKTETFVDEHWEEIDNMAKYLMKKNIVTSDELEQFVKEV